MLPRFQHDPARRAEFLGSPVDLLTMPETVAAAADAMRRRVRLQHVALNVAKLVTMGRDAVLRRDVQESDLVSMDGMGIVWGCRLVGLPAAERVTGVDLMQELMAVCEREGFRPYIFGAKQDVLERAVAELRRRHPKLELAGWRNGYFKPDQEAAIAEEIRAAKPDCLFIAISTPMKENFLHTWRDRLDVPFLMGVGGTIDVIAGHVQRAPAWMQRWGIEWLYRLLQEPRRMWRRYLFSNAEYGWLLVREVLRRRRIPRHHDIRSMPRH